MRLVYKKNGEEVKEGDLVRLDDCTVTVSRIVRPHKFSSTGRVIVRFFGTGNVELEYFPSVIGAEWIERDDREAVSAGA